MATNCTQTDVPTVDNTAVACDEYISTDCIIHEAVITYLNLPENSSVTDILTAFLASLTDARNRIEVLEAYNTLNP